MINVEQFVEDLKKLLEQYNMQLTSPIDMQPSRPLMDVYGFDKDVNIHRELDSGTISFGYQIYGKWFHENDSRKLPQYLNE
jgi:hypothetical protein